MKLFFIIKSSLFILFIVASISSCRPADIQEQFEQAYELVDDKKSPKWKQANTILKELLPYSKNDDNFLVFYAISEMNLGNYILAEKYIKRAIKINDSNSFYYYFLANIYYRNNQFNDALKSLETSLNLNPNNKDAFILLVKTEYKIYSYKIKFFFTESNSVKKLDSKEFKKIPETLYILAARHYNYNEMQKAFLLLKNAEKIDNRKPETLINIAVICDIRQFKSLAKRYYQRYLTETEKKEKYLTTRTQVKKRLKQL